MALRIEHIRENHGVLVRQRARANAMEQPPAESGGIYFNCLSDPAQLRNGDRAADYRIQGEQKNPCELLETVELVLIQTP